MKGIVSLQISAIWKLLSDTYSSKNSMSLDSIHQCSRIRLSKILPPPSNWTWKLPYSMEMLFEFLVCFFFCNSAITVSHNFARLSSQRSLCISSPPRPSQSLSPAQWAQLCSSSSCSQHLRPTLMSQQHTPLKEPHPRVSASCFDSQVLLSVQSTHCLVQPRLYPHKLDQFFHSFFHPEP